MSWHESVIFTCMDITLLKTNTLFKCLCFQLAHKNKHDLAGNITSLCLVLT